MLLRPRVQACLLRSSVRALPMRLRQRLPAQPLNFAMMFSSAIFPPAADVFDQITRGVTNMTFRSKPVKAVVKDDSLDIGWCKLDMMCFGMRNIQSSVHIFYYLCAICSQQLTATQLPSFISCFFLFLTDFDDAGCFNITVCFSPFIHAHVLWFPIFPPWITCYSHQHACVLLPPLAHTVYTKKSDLLDAFKSSCLLIKSACVHSHGIGFLSPFPYNY